MNRLLLGLAGIVGIGLWLLTEAGSVHSAPPQQSAFSVQYSAGDAYQQQRGYSPAVITRGGRIVWLAGQTATQDSNGKSLLGDFPGQARAAFATIDRTLKRNGASLQNLVTLTIFVNDPRNGDEFVKVRREFFPNGKFPAATLITVSNFAQPGVLLEIQGVAVVDDGSFR